MSEMPRKYKVWKDTKLVAKAELFILLFCGRKVMSESCVCESQLKIAIAYMETGHYDIFLKA